MRIGIDYRADLDGLRAVAVVPVILFHLGLPYTPGGFVGVDVFFVLSGYLITRQIALELAENRFSLWNFYDRRVRRIFPALFAMLFVSTVIALPLLLPRDLDMFGESLAAAVLSISNFYFWSESGYFAPTAETMPLLHTWSLAVEEQFYLLFPALLMIAWRFGRTPARHCVVVLAILSFAASLWAVRTSPHAAFYLLPTRAWELLIGSILALMPATTSPTPSWVRSTATTLGLGGIGIAVFAYHPGMPFPGLAATLPVFGCALVIWAGQNTHTPSPYGALSRPLVIRLLELRPLVFIGLISYSLYLWHWPLIVFARYTSPAPLSLDQAVVIAIATFGIACASWKFIEQPLRRGRSMWPTRKLRLRYSSIAVACLALVGTTLDIGNGFPWLQSKAVLAVVDDESDRSPLRKRCHFAREDQGHRALEETCVSGDASGQRIVVLSDSHGAELSYALSEVAGGSLLHVRQISASACPPALDFSHDGRQDCLNHNRKMIDGLADSHRATVLIAASYFVWSAMKPSIGAAFWTGIEATVASLRRSGHDVILLGGWPPHDKGRLPHVLANEVRLGRSAEAYVFAIDRSSADNVDERLKRIAERHSATYLPLTRSICGDSRQCRGMIHGQAIYFDRDHLSVSAARHVVRDVILPALASRQHSDRP